MFKKISGFKTNGILNIEVDKRFEFFFHYWSTFNPKNNLIFFYENRFESHRSLLNKIIAQIDFNFLQSYDKFKRLFLNHSYFSNTNIIARKKSIQNRHQNIVNIIDPTGSTSETQKKKNYINNKSKIRYEIIRIKSVLIERKPYNVQLANELIKIISIDKPLNDRGLRDLKFLITAYIVELYHYGYSVDFILKIPDILIFNDPINNFPFEKTLESFENKATFEQYVENEKKDMNLGKMLNGLVNLINREVKDGFFIFKIDNVFLKNPHPVTIGDTTFYNPQIESQLKVNDQAQHDRVKHVENFYQPRKNEEIDISRISHCNAIIKSKFKASNKIESSKELISAFLNVKNSLFILTNLMNRFGEGNKGYGEIQLHKHFKLHKNRKLAGFNFNIYRDLNKRLDISEKVNLKYFKLKLESINTLTSNTELERKIFTVLSKYKELSEKNELFNFKDLWISWEAIAKRNELIEFAKNCLFITMKIGYITKIKIFLSTKIQMNPFFPETSYYTLSDKQIKNIGLDVELNRKVPTKKFINNYKALNKLIPTHFFKDLSSRIDQYLNDPNQFFKELECWVENVFNDVYIERNMEVHSDIKNELSKIKLKNDFILISKTLTEFLLEFIDKRNPNNIQLIFSRVENYKNKL